MKRKIFAALLAVMMVVSMLPLSVMAEITIEAGWKVQFHQGSAKDKNGNPLHADGLPLGAGPSYVVELDAGESVTFPEIKDTGLTPRHPEEGYYFYRWLVNGTPVKPGKTYTYGDLEEIFGYYVPQYGFVIHAEWRNLYDVTFNNGDGEWPEGVTEGNKSYKDAHTFKVSVTYNKALADRQIPAAPVREGYTFAGWDTIPATMPAKEVTVNATWKANQYTITFDTDGGSEIASIEQDYGTEITAPEAPTKTGYTFAGWEPALPETMPVNGLTVKAKWTANTDTKYTVYHVHCDANDQPSDAGVFFMKTLEGTTGEMTKAEEYTGDAVKGYTVQPIEQAVIAADGSTKVYVYYFLNKYTITYKVDGKEYSKDTVQYKAEINTPAAPEKVGYTFAGWDPAVPATMPANDVEVTATWTTNAYNLDFNGNSGYVIDPEGNEVEKLTRTIFYGNDFAMPEAVRDGYTFAGWSYTNAEGDEIICAAGEPVNSLASEHGARIALTARWTKNNYTIEFALDGGEISEEECTALQIEDNLMACKYAKDYVLPTPTKTGYTFMGWEFEKDGETVVKLGGETVRNLTTKDGDTVTLTAQWEENLYTLHFDSNGGEAVKTKTLRYNAEYTVPATTRDGYTFLGWECVNRSTKEVVDFFEEGEVITKLTDKHGAHFDLTAQWDVNVYTLHFDSNGGEAVKTKSLRYESEYTIPATTREGYIFLGWECVDRSTKESVGFFEAGTVISKLTDKHGAHFDLTAQWELIEYRLQFNAGKDQGTFADGNRFFNVTMTIEDGAYVLAEEPTRIGYELLGWKVGDEKVAADYAFTVAELLEIAEVSYDANGNPYFKITARWNGSDVTVEYAFTSGAKLPEEVMALLPVDENVYHEGDVITAPVIADSVDVEGGRWKFEGWSVDSYTVTAEDAESGEILILGNWRFLQKFERPKFEMPRLNFRSIVIDTTEGGKTDVSGKTVGAMGSTRKFVITPDEGFEIDEVLVNGKPVEVSKNGEISFVVTDHTHVEVYFAEIEG